MYLKYIKLCLKREIYIIVVTDLILDFRQNLIKQYDKSGVER